MINKQLVENKLHELSRLIDDISNYTKEDIDYIASKLKNCCLDLTVLFTKISSCKEE